MAAVPAGIVVLVRQVWHRVQRGLYRLAGTHKSRYSFNEFLRLEGLGNSACCNPLEEPALDLRNRQKL